MTEEEWFGEDTSEDGRPPKERRVVASTVAELLGVVEARARELMAPKGPLGVFVLERTNPHHRTGPKMRVVPLNQVLEWADRNGDVLERWQAEFEKGQARRDRSAAKRGEPEG